MTEDYQRDINMGEEAKRLLESPAFEEIWRRMESEVSRQWMDTCELRDQEGQTLLLQRAKVIKRTREVVIGMIEQGKLAADRKAFNDLRNESAGKRAFRGIIGR